MALATLFEGIDAPPDPNFADDAPDMPRTENALGHSARDALVLSMVNSNRCRAEARNYANSLGKRNEWDDFESVAFLACVQAARYFDQAANPGVSFQTYATSWIRRSLIREAVKIEPAAGMDCWDTVADTRMTVEDDEVNIGDIDEGHGDRESSDRKPNGEQMVHLLKLPKPIRDVVILCVFDCFTPEQIADRLHMEVKDVKLAIRNAGKTIDKFMKFDNSPENMFADHYADAWPENDHAI